jgi:hypothetical protein
MLTGIFFAVVPIHGPSVGGAPSQARPVLCLAAGETELIGIGTIADLKRREDVTWNRSCLQLQGLLPLGTVQENSTGLKEPRTPSSEKLGD